VGAGGEDEGVEGDRLGAVDLDDGPLEVEAAGGVAQTPLDVGVVGDRQRHVIRPDLPGQEALGQGRAVVRPVRLGPDDRDATGVPTGA
jgi:hypothetical protein